MKLQSKGILPASNVYFHTQSETARRLYLYPLCTGHYVCNHEYEVNRNSYNSFLLLFVIRGSGYIECNGQELPICAEQLVLLDCYAPHRYGTHSEWEIIWVHFDGAMARAYFDTIAKDANCAILRTAAPANVLRSFHKIYDMYHEKAQASEPTANKYITNILTEFLLRNSASPTSNPIIPEELLTYITENLQQPLSLDELAKRASLSPYYFIRQFKKETGYTPHEYLVVSRVSAAKFYLKTTALPIKDIAYRCGFSSESSFCTTFKRIVEMTPLTYRRSNL